jgi:hypothetical protein
MAPIVNMTAQEVIEVLLVLISQAQRSGGSPGPRQNSVTRRKAQIHKFGAHPSHAKPFADKSWAYGRARARRGLQQSEPDDYFLATGETVSVRSFCEAAAVALDLNLVWEGEGRDTIGIDRRSGKTLIRINPKFYRPAEVDVLVGDASRANLSWSSTTKLQKLVEGAISSFSSQIKRGPWLT